MEENEIFLKYLIDEEIYIIDDKTTLTPDDDPVNVKDRNIKPSVGKDGRQIPDSDTKSPVPLEADKKGDEYIEAPSHAVDNKLVKRYQDITVLILDYDDQNTIPPEHTDLLNKILQSVNLDLDSIEMVFRDEFDKLDAKNFIDCKVIAFITRVPEQIHTLFAVEKYMINNINGNQIIASDTFSDLIKDRSLKRKLWEKLKSIYRF